MSFTHLNDHELQRHLNNSCTELEARRASRHLKDCSHCRSRFEDFAELEAQLEELPMLQAPDRLAERIMYQIHAKPWERDDSRSESPSRQSSRWRPELMHGLIATAATFILVLTGIPSMLMKLDPNRLENGVEATVAQLTHLVELVSRGMLT